MNNSHPDSIPCPQCRAMIPVCQGYPNWCDRCEWNVGVEVHREFTTFRDRINLRFGERYGAQLFRQVMESASSLKPEFSLSRSVAYALALLVHLLTLMLLPGGLLLLTFGWPNIAAVFIGLLCLCLAWALRPRFGSTPDGVLSRDTHPALYTLVERIADELGLERVDGLIVDHQFNASFQRVGLRGRTYITLGLPLFSILDADEQIALIGHEVAHGVNGDVQRSFLVGSAAATLEYWDYFLRPKGLFSSESGLPGLFMLPVNLFLLALAGMARLGEYGLSVLLYRDSQRAEYLADQLATRVAGGDAMCSMLEKSYFSETYDLALQRTALNKGVNLFEELQSRMAEMPEREKERIRRRARLDGSRVDATHPPTPYRVRFIEHHGVVARCGMFSERERRDILSELSKEFDAIQRAAVDEYKAGLYR